MVRRIRRRRFRKSKALKIARSVSRKIAGEVRKADWNAIIPETSFTQITPAFGTAADNATSLPDYGYLYTVWNTSAAAQGLRIGDFAGNQVRAKYMYLGIHLQMPTRPSTTTTDPALIQQPLCIRCMIVQDSNMQTKLTLNQMLYNLFGLNTSQDDNNYFQASDFTLLPINPQQPGRFNVIRDFKMYVSPGFRQDYYKKVILLQRDLFSGGRFYFSMTGNTGQDAPGEVVSQVNDLRNNIYVLLLYQSPTLYGANTAGSPDFTISLQSRLAYYDN